MKAKKSVQQSVGEQEKKEIALAPGRQKKQKITHNVYKML